MKIYCSGIGGIGLSAYAALQNAAGHTVFGSDKSQSPLLDDLSGQGIAITHDQSGAAIQEDIDLLVYSEAIPASAPERQAATKLGIPQKSYPEALGDLSSSSRVIAVCGTHGKSSTTAMVARLMLEAGLDPTIVVGTKMDELQGRNWHKGQGEFFLLEACEYRRSFLHYQPEIIVLTTCDGDHYDYYKDIDDYRGAFREFFAKLPATGTLVTHLGDPDCSDTVQGSHAHIKDADSFPLVTLRTPGKHMQRNGQLALALADHLGISREVAESSLHGFAGTWRRMQMRGVIGDNITLIDDYGHHPKEISVTLAAMREQFPERRIVCVFQPHTHDRTLKFYDDFIHCFRDTDILLISDIYEARKDIEKERVDMKKFIEDIRRASKTDARSSGSLAETEKLLRDSLLKPNDVLLCMGAGDITTLADQMLA